MTATAAEPGQQDGQATETETPERDTGVRIDGKVHEGPADFTLSEAQYIRGHCELTAQDLILGADRDPTDPDVIQAIAWVVLHRVDPKVEWETVLEKHTINVGDFWVFPPEGKQSNPPGSRRKRSS